MSLRLEVYQEVTGLIFFQTYQSFMSLYMHKGEKGMAEALGNVTLVASVFPEWFWNFKKEKKKHLCWKTLNSERSQILISDN